ncbi:MAG: divergent polysaccharide deacetylase family protein, partial [Deltaproteobacteria bacterium]|nr:divergent polysaccharide deacetylase family protein [Deltaproteobacteria bacterium]
PPTAPEAPAKPSAKEAAPARRPQPPATVQTRPPKDRKPAYEESVLAFHRHLALTDATILAALRGMGLSDQAIRVSRVWNVVEGGLHYERAEMGLDLKGLSPAKLEERLLSALSGLDFPVTLTLGEDQGGLNSLAVWLDGHLTHSLRINHLPAPEPSGRAQPLAAIIIDDLGYHPQGDRRFLDLNLPLTLAVLPFSPCGRELAQEAGQRGLELMVHTPMEPHGYPQTDPGPGALLTSMDQAALRATLSQDLDFLPQAKGINNHMGSKLTEDSRRLKTVMAELKRREMFFIDSRTTPLSKVLETARQAGVKSAQRSIFLDNVTQPAAIRAQVRRFVARARAEGQAIAIGHPHPQTRQVLAQMAPELNSQVRLVPASRLVQ